jgi:hypothetical protein
MMGVLAYIDPAAMRAITTLQKQVSKIMTDVNSALAALPAISSQLVKVQAEITGKIAELEALITAGGTAPLTAEQQAAFDAIQASLASLDGIVPDAPPAA